MSEKKTKMQKSNAKSIIYAKRRYEKWMEGSINKEMKDGYGMVRLNKKKLLEKISINYKNNLKIRGEKNSMSNNFPKAMFVYETQEFGQTFMCPDCLEFIEGDMCLECGQIYDISVNSEEECNIREDIEDCPKHQHSLQKQEVVVIRDLG